MIRFENISEICVYRDSDLATVRCNMEHKDTFRVIKLGNENDTVLLKALRDPKVVRMYDRTPEKIIRIWEDVRNKYHLGG